MYCMGLVTEGAFYLRRRIVVKLKEGSAESSFYHCLGLMENLEAEAVLEWDVTMQCACLHKLTTSQRYRRTKFYWVVSGIG
jgi:hypothetical protein